MEKDDKDLQAKKELIAEAFNKSKESLFFEEMLERNSTMFGEAELINDDESCKIEDSIKSLYNSLPMNNGLRPSTGLSSTESSAWDLIEAIFENDKVNEYLTKVLAVRGIQEVPL